MPGVVGLITKMRRQEAEAELLRMVESIRHEPSYETDIWVDESLGIYVGWAIREGSFAHGIPLHNEHGDVTLVFSGEEYPSPDIRHQLRGRGHTLASDGPSYLVHLFEDDPNFPAGLNGIFHGLVCDRRRGTVTVFNDRYGMHRICYHEGRDAFYFAAEAKAILSVRPELRSAEPRSLGELVAFSCVLEDRTMFKGVYVLPGGSAWVFQNAVLTKRRTYFCPRDWEEQTPLEPQAYFSELRTVLSRNLPRYFLGQSVGMAITGGLDTRVILACYSPPPDSLSCYTFGGMFRDSEDVRLARRITALCRQPHEVIQVGDEFLKEFPHYAERCVYLTEGGVDVSRAADLYVSEKAREIAPVKIVGTYGSEILRHAVMFKPTATTQQNLFQPELLELIDEASKTYRRVRSEHPVTFAAFRQSPWYHHGILALEQSQLSVRSPFLDGDFVRTVYREPSTSAANDDVRLRLIAEGEPCLAQVRSDRGVGGGGNRLSAAVSRNFLEFTFKAEYAYDYGMPQWLARVDRFLSPLRPERIFLGRHKLLHFRIWYRDRLSEYVRQLLLDPRTLSRPFLNRKMVEAVVSGHRRGERNYTVAIHKLLTVEILHRLFLDSR